MTAVFPTDRRLRELHDVVVFSVKGDCSLASLLSGGDYDGDKIWVCWDSRLVEPFKNSRSRFNGPWDPAEWFDKQSCRLKDLPRKPAGTAFSTHRVHNPLSMGRASTPTSSPALEAPEDDVDAIDFDQFFRKGFESSIQDSILGWCSNVLETSVYTDRRPTLNIVLLAKLCGALVDAPKQGLTPTEKTKEKIRAVMRTSGPKPAYKSPRERYPLGNPSKWCILDRLVFQVAHRKIEQGKQQLHDLQKTVPATDGALSAPAKREWGLASSAGEGSIRHRVMHKLSTDLQDVRSRWAHDLTRFNHDINDRGSSKRLPTAAYKKTLYHATAMYRAVRPLALALEDPDIRHWYQEGDRPGSDWNLLKASMAFYPTPSGFAWCMALPEYCEMKARATDPHPRTMIRTMHGSLKPNKRLLPEAADDIELMA